MKKPPESRKISVRRTHPALKISPAAVRKLFHTLEHVPGPHAPAGELSIALMTGPEIVELHGRFLNDPTPTDVITFDGDDSGDFGGEICVSVDQALAQCGRYGTDFATELTLYLVHGWLHLAGFDDHAPADIAAMRAAEARSLDWLRARGAIPDFSMKAS